MNDFYEASGKNEFPLGNLQMLGKLQGPMIKSARPWAPNWSLEFMKHRSIDIYLTSEDLPSLDNRVRVDNDRILIDWEPTNLAPHGELVKRITRIVRKAGYPLIVAQKMGIKTNSPMCGTAVAGHDPATSVLDAGCRSHDIEKLVLGGRAQQQRRGADRARAQHHTLGVDPDDPPWWRAAAATTRRPSGLVSKRVTCVSIISLTPLSSAGRTTLFSASAFMPVVEVRAGQRRCTLP